MSPLLGVFLKLLSALFLTVMAAAIKSVSTRYPIGEIVFARSFFALIPLLIWLAWRAELPAALKTRNLRSHLKRGITGASSMFAGFTALQFLPLSEAVAIGYTAPLVVVVLAALVLKERVRIYRWSAVTIGFAGVLIMLSPHLGVGGPIGGNAAIGAALALAGAFFSAFAAVEVRLLTQTEQTGAIVFYFMLLTSLLGLSTIALGWTIPTPQDALLLFVIGILGGLGQILIVQAYRYGDASLIAPFDYSSMLWAIAIGWFWFGEWPASAILIGAAIVMASGIYVILREHQLGLARRAQREVDSSRMS
ncbi:DMT family transporter [Bosea sp. (in: a-proteobacteria)]|uniref:DMT family transporter n=1 Tax=Bosea sp. (in: a-proteobacteria) TaxID=1871050 RepID=UPI00260A2B87|nr:DMT family transporter [Bosea sp. (in: a-proteobacteria)]MCO5092119.1 DMT family transporter [Bosea sp. (in: a-proteobacteria)]